jgi:hypothetical protein
MNDRMVHDGTKVHSEANQAQNLTAAEHETADAILIQK